MKIIKLSSCVLWITLMVVFYFPNIAFALTQQAFDITSDGHVQGLDTFMPATVYPQIPSPQAGRSCTVAWFDGTIPDTATSTFPYPTNSIAIGSLSADCNISSAAFANLSVAGGSPPPDRYMLIGYDQASPSGYAGWIPLYYESFHFDGSTWVSDGGTTLNDTSTHIISVTPAASSTIATSSVATFGAVVNVNQNDYITGMTVQIKYAHEAQGTLSSVACTDCLFTLVTFPVLHSGVSILSTTSPALAVGRYVMVTTIRNSSLIDNALQFLGFGQFATLGVKTATTTTFVAAQRNAYDILTDSMVGSINDYLASSTVSFASCTNWTQLSLVDCMNLLFVPQWGPIKQAVDNFRNGFLSYWPWGYVTRFAFIMSGSATTTLPAFQVNMNNVLPPGTVDGNYTLDMNDMLAGGAAAVNGVAARGGTSNLQDIAEPMVRLFLALLILIIIVRDLTHIGAGHASIARRGHV